MLSQSQVSRRVALVAIPVLVALAWTTAAVRGQSGTSNGEWTDLGSGMKKMYFQLMKVGGSSVNGNTVNVATVSVDTTQAD